jgi:lipoyl-dependent peroxiredoxin
MPTRTASAEWKGTLAEGRGTLSTESDLVKDAPYTFASRFESGAETNPEELIAAAHAACFSMAFANGLSQAGHPPDSVRTEARVKLEKGDSGFAVSGILLLCRARVPGVSESDFQEQAKAAKAGCPISKALAAVPIELEATLEG